MDTVVLSYSEDIIAQLFKSFCSFPHDAPPWGEDLWYWYLIKSEHYVIAYYLQYYQLSLCVDWHLLQKETSLVKFERYANLWA